MVLVPDRIISLLQRHDQREETVFILLYPAGDKDSSERIEEIRGSYRKIFVLGIGAARRWRVLGRFLSHARYSPEDGGGHLRLCFLGQLTRV
jgi:hypothetical protein